MENQKLKLADFKENQLSKVESATLTGGGRKTIYIYLDSEGNMFDAAGNPIKDPGNGSGSNGEITFVYVNL